MEQHNDKTPNAGQHGLVDNIDSGQPKLSESKKSQEHKLKPDPPKDPKELSAAGKVLEDSQADDKLDQTKNPGPLYSQKEIEELGERALITETQAASAVIMSRNMSHNLGSHVMAYLKQQFDSQLVILNNEDTPIGNISPKQIEELGERALITEIQAARAVIMSRNMSHNLGSHVMAYLKQQFDSQEVIRNKWKKIPYKALPDELVSYLIGVGKFIGYLQERQDYIATVSTTYIPIATPVDFKDAIFDCLNHDLKAERYPTVDNSTNLLLSYIALSEGYHRNEDGKPSLNIIFEKEDRKIVTGHEFDRENEKREASVDDIRSFEFSLPSGLVGRQAIFSIIENLIRNAAKHEQTANGSLDIRLSICDGEEIKQFWCFKDKDNYYYGEQYLIGQTSDISDMMLFTISYQSSQKGDKMKDLVRQLRKGVSLFDDNDNLDYENNKGLKEIGISAAWLRGDFDEYQYLRYSKENNYSFINGSFKKAPLVYITGNEKTGDLYFTIFLKKCLELAFLPEGEGESAETDWKHFRNKGWKELSSKKGLKSTDYTFKHIIVANRETYDELRPYSSNRLTCWGDIDDDMRAFLDEHKWDKDSILRVIHSLHTGLPITPHETIYIWDSHTVWDDSEKSKTQTVEEGDRQLVIRNVDEDPVDSAEYVYRRHHDSRGLLPFLNNHMPNRHRGEGVYSQIKFVEGISGGDSTHRLVRHMELNIFWYYSHLYAMKKRVAIFDERLFKSVHHVSEAEALKEGCEEPVFSDTDQKELTWHSKSVVFDHKGVHIFSLIEEKNETKSPVWAIVGCKIDWENKQCCYQKFASLSLDDTGNVVCEKFVDDSVFNFDYISIHQGLLDKLYESFHFKDKSNDDEKNEKGKFDITNTIYNAFIASPKTLRIKGEKNFIVYNTNLFVHSGRGSISHENMPQPQPFIQYSAIQHAVFDCKYTLIELLDYSKYFKLK